jgi:glycosyltransferase involved in cell wall biosynthesis
MKVAWMSNAPWCATGYGAQTAQACRRMVRAGHDVAIVSNYGLQGRRLSWEGIKVYPSGWDLWSNDVMAAHAADHFGNDAGWLITLFDVWALRNPMLQRLNVASWVPIDHQPIPPRVVEFFRHNGAVPIAMSRFGLDELQRAGLDALYVPHGIDTAIYQPTPTINGQAVREVFGLPADAFVVGMVANNKGKAPSRKAFDQNFLAFSAFRQYRTDAVLYVHAERDGVGDGVNLARLAEACGIPESALFFADQYAYRQGLPDPIMAGLYSSFDVLLAASRGEGFGIPVVEAQACGVPVIVTDWTAQAELCGSGWRVDYRREWDEDQAAWWAMPLPEDIVGALCEAYDASQIERLRLGAEALAFAAAYDADRVFEEFWRPTLAQLEQRIPTAAPLAVAPVDMTAVIR